MFERIKAMLAQWDSIREVNALSGRDLMDLNMTRDQLLDFVQMPKDSPERLTAMAHLLGMTQADLTANHPEYLDRVHACGHCSDRIACAKTLSDGHAINSSDVPFCPNAAGIAGQLLA